MYYLHIKMIVNTENYIRRNIAYQLYDIANAGIPYINASLAPATVPEYTLHTKNTSAHDSLIRSKQCN